LYIFSIAMFVVKNIVADVAAFSRLQRGKEYTVTGRPLERSDAEQ
jgi:hypothetical protein